MALEKAKEEFGYEEYNDSDGEAKETPGGDAGENYEDQLKALEQMAMESDEEGSKSKEKEREKEE